MSQPIALMRISAVPRSIPPMTGRSALALEDGLDEGEAGLGGDGGDALAELEVHQCEGLLHVLDVVAGEGHQHLSLPQVAAEHEDLILGAEGAGEQSAGVEPLEPLAIVDVALGPALQSAGLAGIGGPAFGA